MDAAGNDRPQTPKENLRAIRVFCIAILAGIVLLTGILLLLGREQGATMVKADTRNLFLLACGMLAIACPYLAIRNYNKKIQEIRSSGNTLMARLNVYRAVVMKYMAWCDMPAIFAAISFYSTGDSIFLTVVALMLGAMLWKAPFGKKWVRELGADWKDQEEIMK